MAARQDLYRLSAVETARAIREGAVSASEVAEATLARIAALNDHYKAFITVDAEGARRTAQQVDAAHNRGEDLGPLAGVPLAVKDLADTKGLRTTYGSLVFKDHIPQEDDLVVARLRAAGAVILGKTNTPEFGYGAICENKLYGPTCNPFDATRTSGGSSGGSAVAVSTGMAALGHATDFGGSARIPAAFCGIYGLRPTVGRVPSVPKPLLWDGLNVHGAFGRTPGDVALMLSTMAGSDARDPLSLRAPDWSEAAETAAPQDLRIGFSATLGIAPVDDAVTALFDVALGKIGRIWSAVEEDHPDCSEAIFAFGRLRAGFINRTLAPLLERRREDLTPTVIWNIERGAEMSASDYLAAEEARGRLYLDFLRFFERHDILATVTTTLPPFPNDQGEVLTINGQKLESIIDYLSVTFTISAIGLPALSIPIGRTPEGLPVGMQLVAPPFKESLLLAVAEKIARETGLGHVWPEI